MSAKADQDAEANQVRREKEKILKKAQKLVYPVGSTRKRIAYISSAIFIVFVVLFTSITASLVYIFKDDSEFTYQVSKIVPFPVGVVGTNIVTYEDYLFEYRDDVHFLAQHSGLDVSSEEYRTKVAELKTLSAQRIYANALAENIASENNIDVDKTELEARLLSLKAQARAENSLSSNPTPATTGSDNPRFNEIIMQYYGWKPSDLERDLKIQLLKTKLIPTIDEETKAQAELVKTNASKKGADFSSLAKEYSQDKKTASKGGVIGVLDDKNRQLYPQNFISAAEKLQDKQVSQPIATDYGIHIIKRTSTKDGKPVISHILFNYGNANQILAERLKEDESVRKFLELN